MRLMKIPIIVIILVVITAGVTWSQTGWEGVLKCNDIDESIVDVVQLEEFRGKPGDTVWLPVYAKTDSIMSGFMILIRWDDQYLTRLKDPLDTSYCVFQLKGRLLEAQNSTEKTIFYAQLSQNVADSGSILTGFNLGFSGDTTGGVVFVDPGEGVIFRLGFEVSAAMPHLSTADFWYHQINDRWWDTLLSPPQWHYTDCRRTEFSLQWNDASTVVTYPTTTEGFFVADTAPAPTIHQFTAPDSVEPGDPFVLSWIVDNADSLIIEGNGISPPYVTYELADDNIFYASTTEGTYTYTLTAANEFTDTVTATVDMVVESGGGPVEPHAPTIQVGSYFAVDVGGTLNFSVSASDPDNDNITLDAVSLPPNATFPVATGYGSAQSTFNFTPAINQGGTTINVTFRAVDGTYTSTSTTVIDVLEPEYDKLFSSSIGASAVGGISGKDGIIFPVNLVTSQTVYGVQLDFVYDAQMFGVVDVDVTDNTAEYVVYENIGVTPGDVRFVMFGMANEPIGTDGTEILYVEMEIDDNATPGRYPVYLQNAWESVNPDPEFPSLPLETDSGLIQVDAFGDVNLDMLVNIADLVSVIGYIIGDYGFTARRFEVADVVVDGTVDVYDLVAIINIVYGAPPQSVPGLYIEDLMATVELDLDDLTIGANDVMVVRSEIPMDIAAAELEILYDPAMVNIGAPSLSRDIGDLDMRFRDNGNGRLKVLLCPKGAVQSSDKINAGQPDLLEIPVSAQTDLDFGTGSAIRLNQVLLSTASATAVKVEGFDSPLPLSFVLQQNYPNPFNPMTTIEFSFGAGGGGINERVTLDIFNILGQNVTRLLDKHMPPGNHEIMWDGTDGGGGHVASGIYLYKLTVGQESQTRKMLLLK